MYKKVKKMLPEIKEVANTDFDFKDVNQNFYLVPLTPSEDILTNKVIFMTEQEIFINEFSREQKNDFICANSSQLFDEDDDESLPAADPNLLLSFILEPNGDTETSVSKKKKMIPMVNEMINFTKMNVGFEFKRLNPTELIGTALKNLGLNKSVDTGTQNKSSYFGDEVCHTFQILQENLDYYDGRIPISNRIPLFKKFRKRIPNLNFEIKIFNNSDLLNIPIERFNTLLFFGETGSGKTSSINSFVNFLLGINFENTIRVKLFHEAMNGITTKSQTKEIISYRFKDLKGNLWNIVDNPGFGDTEGVELDNELPENLLVHLQINKLMNVKAFIFVIKDSSNRNVTMQKYVTSCVQSLLGKDVARNIFFILTHWDCMIHNENPIIEVIRENLIKKFEKNDEKLSNELKSKSPNLLFNIKINNQYIFSDPDQLGKEIEKEAELQYNESKKQVELFAGHLLNTKNVDLNNTLTVLSSRVLMNVYFKHFFSKQNEIHKYSVQFDDIAGKFLSVRNAIEKSGGFTTERKVEKSDIKNTHEMHLNCKKCNFTCKQYVDNYQSATISSLLGGANCQVCPEKCSENSHEFQPGIIIKAIQTETITNEELKKKHEDLKIEYAERSKEISHLLTEMHHLFKESFEIINKIKNCFVNLKFYALFDIDFDTKEYYEENLKTIEKPNDFESDESKQKVETLRLLLKRIEFFDTIVKANDLKVCLVFLKGQLDDTYLKTLRSSMDELKNNTELRPSVVGYFGS